MLKRYLFLLAGLLIVWGSLAYRLIKYSDPMDRMVGIIFGVGVTVLAVLISRGPLLPKSRGGDDGGTNSVPGNYDSHDSHGHHDDGGSDGSDGGDGGGH